MISLANINKVVKHNLGKECLSLRSEGYSYKAISELLSSICNEGLSFMSIKRYLENPNDTIIEKINMSKYKTEIDKYPDILTYGHILEHLIFPYRKVSGTKISDYRNGITKSQFFNHGYNSISRAIGFCGTTRHNTCRYVNGVERQSSANLKDNIFLCPFIAIWFYDNRFFNLQINNKMKSREMSLKYMEIKNIEKSKNTWSKFRYNDLEFELKDKSLTPTIDVLVLGKDSLECELSIEDIRKIISKSQYIDNHTKIILYPSHRFVDRHYPDRYKNIPHKQDLELRRYIFGNTI